MSLPIGAGLIATGFGGLWLCSDIWSVALTVVVWTFGEMLLIPASSAYLSDLAPAGRGGEYGSMQSALISISMMLAPSIGTSVLEHAGPKVLWTGSWIAGGLSVVLLAMLPSPRAG